MIRCDCVALFIKRAGTYQCLISTIHIYTIAQKNGGRGVVDVHQAGKVYKHLNSLESTNVHSDSPGTQNAF